MSMLSSIKFNQDGLVAAIAQCADTGQILMQAWMNAEALQLTIETKRGVYFSRSRNTLWHKGEQSGNVQIVHDIFIDCDGDSILLSVTQLGGIACHTGRANCFYRRWDGQQWINQQPVLKDPKDLYS